VFCRSAANVRDVLNAPPGIIRLASCLIYTQP